MAPPPRYTEAQRTAIAQAVLQDHITVAEARRRAAAGELEGVEPFEMSKDAAYNCVRAARLEQAETAAKADPRNSANIYARDVLAALQPSNQALLAQAKAGRNVDSRLRERARLLREFVALQGATEKKNGSASRKPDHNPKSDPAPNLSTLLTDNEEQTGQGPVSTTRDTSPAHPGAHSSEFAGASSPT